MEGCESRRSEAMNANQREMARHALGFPNKKNESYRNHFCIGPGGDGYEDWLDLVEKGLAIRRTSKNHGGDDLFYLTLQGALMVRDAKEHLSREDAECMRRMDDEARANVAKAQGAK